jgi:hypothetical protein
LQLHHRSLYDDAHAARATRHAPRPPPRAPRLRFALFRDGGLPPRGALGHLQGEKAGEEGVSDLVSLERLLVVSQRVVLSVRCSATLHPSVP